MRTADEDGAEDNQGFEAEQVEDTNIDDQLDAALQDIETVKKG